MSIRPGRLRRGRRRPPATIGRAVARHAIAVGALLIVVAVAAAAGMRASARSDARRSAERVAAAVADTAIARLAAHDYSAAATLDRAAILSALEPFLASGSLYRIKLWRIDGGQARIVLSDEARVEGETRQLGSDVPAALAAGAPIVQQMPRDAAHRFEASRDGELMEVFTGFDDAAGARMYLEAYVPVDIEGSARDAMRRQLPLLLGALVALGAATVPVSVAAARRSRRAAEERAALARAAAASSRRERSELARRLHDGPIQDLAAAGITLRTRTAPAAHGDLEIAAVLVSATVRDLRRLAGDLMPVGPSARDLDAEVRRLLRAAVTAPARASCRIEIGDGLGDERAAALYAVCRELVRNAVAHGAAGSIAVELTSSRDAGSRLVVEDDGVGFDPRAQPAMDHLGLRLMRQAVADLGGTLVIDAAPGRGARIVVAVPAEAVPAGAPARRG